MPLCRLSLGLALLFCWFATEPAAAAHRGGAHAYLVRGIFNVSVGLDALAAKLARMGVATSVYGHGEAGAGASAAIRGFKSGRVRSIILIGHSLRGGAGPSIARQPKYSGLSAPPFVSPQSGSTGPGAC